MSAAEGCGGSSNNPPGTGGSTSSTATGGTSTTSSTSTASSSTSASTSTSTTSTSTTTALPTCTSTTEITLGAIKRGNGDGSAAGYAAPSMPDMGSASDPDMASIEFYGSMFNASNNGEATGTFDLSMGGDNNYSTCSRCVTIDVDPHNMGKQFFQIKGSMVINSASDQIHGKLKATLTDVTLMEVTIDMTTFVSTPVANPTCVHIASATFDYTAPPVPTAWTCDMTYFNDGSCDCGCGAADVDCNDATVGSCDVCDDTGSCSTGTGCPGTIDPTNNAVCTSAADAGAGDAGGGDAGAGSDAGSTADAGDGG